MAAGQPPAASPVSLTSLVDFGVNGPVYIRMLRRKPHLSVQPHDTDYVEAIAVAIFLSDRINTKQYSLYRVELTRIRGNKSSVRGDQASRVLLLRFPAWLT